MGLRFLQKNRKMKHFLWTSTAVLCLFTISECRNLVKRDANPSIDPVQSHGKQSHKSALYGFAWETTTTKFHEATTEDIVKFTPGKPVSLDVPGELFGSSFTLVTNLSNTIGDFAVNSAIRAQRLLESMRPFLRFLFGVKGFVIEGPTDKPIFSDPDENKARDN
ncbi:uncharacterized protein LOC126744658 isoform X2 [Anthonomus grandis grandis]|uniref:uncharacterized protein LOC126744658 isoform X2 n=1 Tax=Anthonomus grandis grandis TaxID=2921223 RepID=UPI002165F535|nr:uncharacterized protein LOC126744658 isoform X2 [Anthonomus grandis grandis]